MGLSLLLCFLMGPLGAPAKPRHSWGLWGARGAPRVGRRVEGHPACRVTPFGALRAVLGVERPPQRSAWSEGFITSPKPVSL